MHPETRLVAEHMREFGLSLYGRALSDAAFSEIMRPFAHASSVVLAAHAAEILIKAKIAEEHPLLIFSKLPSRVIADKLMGIEELFQEGKTYAYEALPSLLWATTGIKVSRPDDYISFGKLRNKIAHFAVPGISLADETLKYLICVLEPLIYSFWNISGIPYAIDWDDVIIEDGYLKERISTLGIEIDERIKNLINPTE